MSVSQVVPACEVLYQDGSGIRAHLPAVPNVVCKLTPDVASFTHLLTKTIDDHKLDDVLAASTTRSEEVRPDRSQSLLNAFSGAADDILDSLEYSSTVTSRACSSGSPIRPDVLDYLSALFDPGNDGGLVSELDTGVNLGFEGGLKASGIFPVAKSSENTGDDAASFDEHSFSSLERANYFSGQDATCAMIALRSDPLSKRSFVSVEYVNCLMMKLYSPTVSFRS